MRFIMRAVIESSTRRIFFRLAGASGALGNGSGGGGVLREITRELLFGGRSEGRLEASADGGDS
jgi:hypothetical protein